MTCWALVAVKARPARKARLAGHLSAPERDRLTEVMLQDVLAALRASRSVDGVAVVTAEPGRFDAQVLVLPDPGLVSTTRLPRRRVACRTTGRRIC